ncbi:HNH endonuclease-domain-containing protein [Tuber indicum]|nr:HNH endonuclease-domain-containing protein [Tuber indicum]
MSPNRALPRNVSFYDATNPEEALGGLVQNGSITEANFLDMLGILLAVDAGPLRVQERISNHIVVYRTDVPLKIGVYDIHCEASIQISDEPWIHRLVSRYTCREEDTFRDQVSDRDRRCVISGIVNPEILIQADNWAGFEAAHIFPLEHESLWVRYNHGRWITDMDDAAEFSKINSPQNGILLRADVHQMFKQYLVSVNPDDGYKVVVFTIDLIGLDGRILDPVCRSQADPHCVSDELLRWHFRQSVLANMRGAGEPVFEHDFPPGTDMVGEILAGPCAQERFELEIAARLRETASAQQF